MDLELRDVAVSYADVMALDDCKLALRPGRVLNLVGPNGAGKAAPGSDAKITPNTESTRSAWPSSGGSAAASPRTNRASRREEIGLEFARFLHECPT